MSRRWNPGQLDLGIRRHSGNKFMGGVVDVDLDPIDESDSLGVGLDALGSELRPRGDRRDPALKGPAGEGIGAYHGRQAEARASEIRLIDIGPEPDMIEIGKGYHR